MRDRVADRTEMFPVPLEVQHTGTFQHYTDNYIRYKVEVQHAMETHQAC